MAILDDKDAFLSIYEIKADMELASFRGYAEDILLEKIWFHAIDQLGRGRKGRCKFVKLEILKYAEGLDKALDFLVWNA